MIDQKQITLTMAQDDPDAEWARGQLELEQRIRGQVDILTRERKALEREARHLGNDELEEALGKCYLRLYSLTAEATQGQYTSEDVRRWVLHCKELGARHPRIEGNALVDLVYLRAVPNERLRDAFLANPGERLEIAKAFLKQLRQMEAEDGAHYGSSLFTGKPKVLVLRLCEALGCCAKSNGNGWVGLKIFIPYEQAAALSMVLGINPHDVGI